MQHLMCHWCAWVRCGSQPPGEMAQTLPREESSIRAWWFLAKMCMKEAKEAKKFADFIICYPHSGCFFALIDKSCWVMWLILLYTSIYYLYSCFWNLTAPPIWVQMGKKEMQEEEWKLSSLHVNSLSLLYYKHAELNILACSRIAPRIQNRLETNWTHKQD